MEEPKLMFLVGAIVGDIGFYALSIYDSEERADEEHKILKARLKALDMGNTITTQVGVPVNMGIIEAFEYWSK